MHIPFLIAIDMLTEPEASPAEESVTAPCALALFNADLLEHDTQQHYNKNDDDDDLTL